MTNNSSIVIIKVDSTGEVTDASIVSDPDGVFTDGLKRERIVISGDDKRESVLNLYPIDGVYRMQSFDPVLNRQMDTLLKLMEELILVSKQTNERHSSRR
jgi:hypothetical protein